MPIRIAYSLVTLAPGRAGGAETFARALLDQLTSSPGDLQITVLVGAVLAGGSPRPAPEHVDVRLVRGPAGWGGHRTRQAGMVLAGLRPRWIGSRAVSEADVVHYPLTVPLPKTRQPTVVTLADVAHRDLSGMFSAGERAFRRWAYDEAARRAAVVITPSKFSRERIVETLGVDRERVVVTPLGVPERFSAHPSDQDEEVIASLGVTRPYCFYPANLWPHKNHARLLEAFREVGREEVSLVLTGQRGSRGPELDERIRRSGLAGRVTHLGHVAEDVVPVLYRQAELLVFPSLYEGFGLPVLEAMASGCPVVASSAASLPEVCGDAARLVDPGDRRSIASGIEEVLADGEMRAGLSEAGLRRSQSFTWSDNADRHRLAYERAAA